MPDYNRDRDFSSNQKPNWDKEQYGNEYDQIRNAGNYGNRQIRKYDEQYYGASNKGGYGLREEDRGFGSAGNEFSSDYGRQYNEESRNRYGGDTRNYGNANQGGFDRDWWDRAKDNVSSMFGGRRGEEGPHRGKGPKGYQRSEQRIREDVCERLSEDPYVDATDIEIDIQNNEVVLKGSVDSKEAKRRAEDLAESVLGVRDVQNQLRVNQSWPAHSTGTIASDIERTTRNNQF